MTDDFAAAPTTPADAADGPLTTPMPGAAGDTTGKTWLLWCDLEATGLSPEYDEIIEAAFILTDTDLNEIARYESLVWPRLRARERLNANALVLKMHTDNGLLAELDNGAPDLPDVEARIWKMIHQLVDTDHTIYLAGSGVAAFDRPMIRWHMPWLDKLLHYAPIDVGVLKRTWRMWTGQDISDDNGRKTHRVMADVEGHLREARLFRDAFKGLAS